jgi:HlyD family secretion protein
MFKKIKGFIVRHKFISAIIIIVIVVSGFYIYKAINKANQPTKYTLTTVQKGTIVSSVVGTGQTSAVEELDVKPKTSGDLTVVAIVGGQTINKGDLIAKIDPTDARQAVDNAKKALGQAKVDLEKMNGVETDLGKLRGIVEKAQDSLDSAYENGFNTVTNAFLNLPTIMTGLQSILFDSTLSKTSQNIDYYMDAANMYNSAASQYRTNAFNSYQVARSSYDASSADFKITNRTSSKTQIELLINETYDTIGEVSQAVKDTINLIQLYQDELTKNNRTPNSISGTHLSSLNGYVNTTNSYLSSLLSIKNSIETDKENLIQTSYDIADQESLVTEKQTALDDANKNLSYCSIYAPFSGVVSAVNLKVGDSVSSGTIIAKIVTKEVIAKISLNEVDASQVKIGQKVTTTFDAVEGLTLTGLVAIIDTVGTVSQGVVSYNVDINFDLQDARVKPGMSVSSNIITDSKQNVLMVASSAVKSKNGSYYVEVLPSTIKTTSDQVVAKGITLEQKPVEVGITDDTNIEITSGLSEGDRVVSRTASSTTKTTTSSSSSRSILGGGESPR